MSYIICKHCGCQMSDKSEACPVCGALRQDSSYQDENIPILTKNKKPKDAILWVLLILSLIFPLLGVVLFFVHKRKRPSAAKGFLIWALYGIALRLMVFLVLKLFLGI